MDECTSRTSQRDPAKCLCAVFRLEFIDFPFSLFSAKRNFFDGMFILLLSTNSGRKPNQTIYDMIWYVYWQRMKGSKSEVKKMNINKRKIRKMQTVIKMLPNTFEWIQCMQMIPNGLLFDHSLSSIAHNGRRRHTSHIVAGAARDNVYFMKNTNMLSIRVFR